MQTAKKKNVMEKRIAETFLRMASSMPVEKITVSDLCRQCGIQRQTFYNHYSDIDGLIESIFDHEGHRIFHQTHSSHTWQEGLYNILISLKKNKEFVTAVYQGISREQLESRLYHQIRALLKDIVDEIAAGTQISETDKDYIIEYHMYAFSGYILNWIRFGMKKDPKEIVGNIDIVIHGSIHEAIERYAEMDKKPGSHKMDKNSKVSI